MNLRFCIGRHLSFLVLPLCIIGLFALSFGRLQAQIAPPGFGAYKHVRWGAEEGAPDGVQQMVQTPDGYLWLAGDALYRFDGVAFERIDWPASSHKHASPAGLMVDRNGDLWVGLRGNGGIAIYRDGALQDLHMPDPPRSIEKMVQAADGTVWAASGMFSNRLLHLTAGRWQSADNHLQLPAGAVMSVLLDRNGGLWIALAHQDGDSGSLAYLAPHATRFREMPVRLSGRPHIAFDKSGALWAADATGVRKLFDQDGATQPAAPRYPGPLNVRTASITFDRDGILWGTTASVGIFKGSVTREASGSSKALKAFSAANGLTSDFTYAPFVDREGSIWIATEGGIDQFRPAGPTKDPTIPADPIHGLGMAASKDGTIYIASRQTLYRVAPHGQPGAILKLQTADIQICTARGAGVWIVDGGRVLRVRGDYADSFPGPLGKDLATGCVEDRLGRLWVGFLSGQLVWRDTAGWHALKGALAHAKVWDMVATTSGDLAFTSPPDLFIISDNRFTRWPAIGNMSMIAPSGASLFLSNGQGLLRIRNGRAKRLNGDRFPWVAQLYSLVSTARGETWMIGRNAISRVATAYLDRAFDSSDAPLTRTLFDAQDGLVSATQHGGFSGPQSVVGGDGRLWFLNRLGAAFFDPETLRSNTLVPTTVVRSVAIDGQTWRDPSSLLLPPGTRALAITYAGLSLAVPQRNRFRYRLDGVDEHWIDAGARRTATYTNLGPGQYRFRVIAANNDGIWNSAGAELNLEILPTFWQSSLFKLACVVFTVFLLWLAYTARLRGVTHRLQSRMAERLEERERIARELHDTLLQSVQALTLRFQLAADDLPSATTGRRSLIEAIDTADHVIAEGRDRVRELRAHEEGDIEKNVRDCVARLSFDRATTVRITAAGAARSLAPIASEEVNRIAGEALFNIRRHAKAETVAVEIIYGPEFVMRFADDGVGIDPALVASGGKPGHFGLAGMRERARKMRANLIIRPLPDRGTELVLTVPGSIAYKAGESGLLARLWSL